MFSQSWSSSSGQSSTTSSSVTSSAMGAHNLVLNIDESKLRTAPSFDASDWNQLQTGTLDQRVYSHFGVDRSSAIGTPGASISGRGASGTYDPNNPSRTQPGSSTLPGSTTQPRTSPPQSSSTPETNPNR
jgi:hypothetical protein